MTGRPRLSPASVLLAGFVALGASSAVNPAFSSSLDGLVDDVAQHLAGSEAVPAYAACVLLAELSATEAALTGLEELEDDAPSAPTSRLCAQYALARLTQESPRIDAFIAAYPTGSASARLWQVHSEAGYPLGLVPPPERYLADLAAGNDEALAKLLAVFSAADGARAEALVDIIADLYLSDRKRVEKAARRHGVDLNLVRRIADWKDGQDG